MRLGGIQALSGAGAGSGVRERHCAWLAGLALIAWTGLVATPALGADLPEIRKAGTLRVLVVDGSPAFFNLGSDGEPGLDKEILEAFARLHKLTLRAVEVPTWGALVPWLLEGRGDLLGGGVTVTPARAQLVDFSHELLPTRNVIVTRKPKGVVETMQQLRGVRVGAMRGSSMAEALVAAEIPFDDGIASGGGVAALRKGTVEAILSGIEDALLYRQSDPAIQVGMFLGPSGSLAFGVRKDAPELKRELDSYVANLRRTPTWNRLIVKYFGEAAPELLKRARE